MVARNDITGDAIQTRGVSDSYRNNYDLIFGKKKNTENNKIKTDDNTSVENSGDSNGNNSN